ncbi:MAG: PqqD family protein [Candidatus Methylomirabilota bacterium]
MDCSNSRYAHHPDVAWRLVQDEALLVDPRTGSIFPLNPVAARLWVLLGDTLPVSEIVRSLFQEFDSSRETIEADVSAFIANALAARLLVEQPGGSRSSGGESS